MKIGFIGTGNMGSAIAIGVSKNVKCDLYLANRTIKKAEVLKDMIGGIVCDNNTVAKECDLIYLCVEPQQAEDVLKGIKQDIENNKNAVLVSVMTAWTIERIRKYVDIPIIRTMPNTPLKINEGIILYDYSDDVNEEKLNLFLETTKGTGLVVKLDEEYIDAASVVSGCAPAYTFMFADSLVSGVEKLGIQKEIATKLAAQMLIGSGKMILETGEDPNKLKEDVCSPGGCTIEGIKIMENNNLKQIIEGVVKASYEKNKKL